jgi:hypothetical protein
MKKSLRCRPEVESLESMMLLSAMPHAVPNPLVLIGTERGTYQLRGTNSVSKAAGLISPLGQVKDSGITSHITGLGNVTMTTKQGKLFVELKLRASGSEYTGTYTITGGTKALVGETGTGTVQVTPSNSGKKDSFLITYD